MHMIIPEKYAGVDRKVAIALESEKHWLSLICLIVDKTNYKLYNSIKLSTICSLRGESMHANKCANKLSLINP